MLREPAFPFFMGARRSLAVLLLGRDSIQLDSTTSSDETSNSLDEDADQFSARAPVAVEGGVTEDSMVAEVKSREVRYLLGGPAKEPPAHFLISLETSWSQ